MDNKLGVESFNKTAIYKCFIKIMDSFQSSIF